MIKLEQNCNSELEIPQENSILVVDCLDNINVKARVTFDCEIFQGYYVTYWQDDDTDVIERVNSIFDLLFEEVLKTSEIKKVLVIK